MTYRDPAADPPPDGEPCFYCGRRLETDADGSVSCPGCDEDNRRYDQYKEDKLTTD